MAAFAVGLVTGLLSGCGAGGGSLLMIWLSLFAGMSQYAAQGINLLYFLPCSAAALVSHLKNRLVELRALAPAILAGCAATAAASLAATALDQGLLRKLFGLFLLCAGLREIRGSGRKE